MDRTTAPSFAYEMRYVICSLGGEEDPWSLPVSTFEERAWIHGGERGLYELAAAIAADGSEVELRGELVRRELDEICEAAGARPRTELPARRPTSDDVVIVPEGWEEPLAYARVALSPARTVLLLLAPPGLFGWSFEEAWGRPDPFTVSIDQLGRPEPFRAMRALGFTLWTHSPGIVGAAERAGVPIAFIGEGQPIPFPEIPPKTVDVVYLEDNRWAEMSRSVAVELGDRARGIPRVTHDDLLRRVGDAKILILPSRVEGTSRIQWEARAMATVPVALSTNPFADGLHESGGAVLVDSVHEMAGTIRQLLGNPGRLARLGAQAAETARAQVDWETYRARVRDALSMLPDDDPGRGARSSIGGAIEDLIRRERDRVAEAESERWRSATELAKLSARRSVRAALAIADVLGPVIRPLTMRRRRGRSHHRRDPRQ